MISVVVPNHNRDLSLLRASLHNSSFHDFEIIEVNRGLERSKQRNIGIQEAKGDIILWLDSDQAVSPGLLREANDTFRWGGITALYVPEIIVASSFFGRIRKFEREFYTGTAIDVPRFVLKSVMPLFDEDLHGPEDADMGQRIPGIKITTRNPLYHFDDISFLEYCRKKAYYTKSMRKYSEKWPNDPCLNFKYRCWDVFTENGKWKKLLQHPILAIGILFLIITRGIIYVSQKG